jgi:hypothetical protein
MNKSLYEICEEARTPIDSEVSAMREAILDYCHIRAKGGYSSVILNHWMICDIFPFTKPDVSRWFNTVSEALRLIHTEDRIWVWMSDYNKKWSMPWVSPKGRYPQVGSDNTWRNVSSDPQEAMLKFMAKISWEHPPKEG